MDWLVWAAVFGSRDEQLPSPDPAYPKTASDPAIPSHHRTAQFVLTVLYFTLSIVICVFLIVLKDGCSNMETLIIQITPVETLKSLLR